MQNYMQISSHECFIFKYHCQNCYFISHSNYVYIKDSEATTTIINKQENLTSKRFNIQITQISNISCQLNDLLDLGISTVLKKIL